MSLRLGPIGQRLGQFSLRCRRQHDLAHPRVVPCLDPDQPFTLQQREIALEGGAVHDGRFSQLRHTRGSHLLDDREQGELRGAQA